ncbi:hypothetical protein [Rhizorhabdus sp.]|uniref:hypothetical protein n=1 Tax=Rhizorhabdus sp. TaxID=1968843 RepID=UPI00198A096F|nr:hypothetical protein [Rhizorhabdus sp.]MBD3762429.1 hypothetical protein [Rhizorhabdus sp.]
MKAIRLHTATADNGGTRHDAGETLTIGDEAGEIALARAEALVAAGSALDATPAQKPSKKAD